MVRLPKFYALGIFLLLLPAAPPGLAAVTAVAVLPPNCVGAAPDCSKLLAEFLTSELGRYGDYRVIEKAQLEPVLTHLAKEQSDLYDQSQAAQFGKLVSAKLVLITTINQSASAAEVTSRLVEAETGLVLSSVSFRGQAGNYLELARQVVRGLFQPGYQSSSRNEGHAADQAFDQNEATYWEAATGNPQGWLEISYPMKMRFSHAEFHCPESAFGSGVPKHFTIEYFDGTRWQMATKVLGNMLQNWAGDFAPQTASKWRIQITDVISGDKPARISEFKLEMREEGKDAIK